MAKLKFQPIKKARAAKAPAAEAGADNRQPTKLTTIIGLLKRPDGASMAELTDATGWQPHSVRGAVSGSLKKQLKLDVVSEQTAAGRVYRIPAAAAA